MAFTGIIPTEGKNFLLDVANGFTAPVSFYLMLFTNNYTPLAASVGSTFPTLAGELTTQYDEATRQLFSGAAAASGSSSNTASKAVFTINTEVIVYGAALLTTSAKADLTGKLIAAGKYDTPKTYVAGDQPTFDCSLFFS